MSTMRKKATEPCQYCGATTPSGSGHLCKKCEDSLRCEGCGVNLNNSGRSWSEVFTDRFYCDPCKKKL